MSTDKVVEIIESNKNNHGVVSYKIVNKSIQLTVKKGYLNLGSSLINSLILEYNDIVNGGYTEEE